MAIVKFVNEKKEIQVPEGSNLRREALRAGVGLYPGINKVLNCHGFGNCGSMLSALRDTLLLSFAGQTSTQSRQPVQSSTAT